MKPLFTLIGCLLIVACSTTIEDLKKKSPEEQEAYYFNKCRMSKLRHVCMGSSQMCAVMQPSAEELLECQEEAKKYKTYIDAGIL